MKRNLPFIVAALTLLVSHEYSFGASGDIEKVRALQTALCALQETSRPENYSAVQYRPALEQRHYLAAMLENLGKLEGLLEYCPVANERGMTAFDLMYND